MLREGSEVETSLKSCKHMGKQNVRILQILSSQVTSLKQIWNNSKHVSFLQIVNQILQHLEGIPETGIHVNHYNQFENQVKPMITYDCIGNYIFLADHNLCHSNNALSLSSEHYSEEEVIVFDDHKLITKEQESHQSSGKKAVIEVQLFHED